MNAMNCPFRAVLLSVHPSFSRFGIVDNRPEYRGLPRRYFTGDRENPWSPDRTKARIWADFQALMHSLVDITKEMYKNLPKQKFTLTLNISMHASAEVSREDLINYLNRTMGITMDYKNQGMGPVPNSFVSVTGETNDIVEEPPASEAETPPPFNQGA